MPSSAIRSRRSFAAFVVFGLSAAASAPLACGGSSGVVHGTSTTEGGTPTENEGGTLASEDGSVGLIPGSPDDAATPLGACGAAGAACAVSTDCCTGSCVSGTCGAAQCVTIGAACPASGNSCCTETCTAGKCAPIAPNPSCTTAGNACTANANCCSGLCTGGTCNVASSFCTQPNDICFTAASCCTGVCNSPNANPVSPTNPGTCGGPPTSGGVNCTGVDGTLCNPADVGCAGGCCSALCAPYGPTGVAICQQAQGCHVEGDLCRVNADCCGGESPDAGVLGGGLVVCSTTVNGGTIGVCMTPTGGNGGGNACVPEGDVCHYNTPPYACSVSSKRSDCCGPQSPPFLACKLDKLGVPRCLAYAADDGGACRQVGNTCATSGDCCDGVPCVPNSLGQLVCTASACVPVTGTCTSSADCCAGETCVIPVGALSGTCGAVTPPPGDGGSGSSSGGGDAGGGLGCASLGQSCAALGCCAGLLCSGEGCTIAPK
jgi:hypothetical protein